ncbi:hypothetical protein [Nitrososphaera viennensis]|uniref:Uncharacterized protein n=1 Tax=Nitrososphaera viennensis TaxID=1034015 RepID=A0A977NP96_9ARCH|nr:hypothetical protein [Nitrososphaera viennensis]UVS70550.1 hypothetical protein NWT39_07130 [Nitrososphaera viennensis]
MLVFFAAFFLLIPFLQPAFAQNDNDNGLAMLESASDQGTFLVRMWWTQADIGADNTFEIKFVEPETGRELEDITYDFIVVSASGQEAVHRQSQAASVQAVAFSTEGPYTIRIANIDGLGEGADFDVRVTPEFAPAAIAAAAGIALATIFGAKFRKRS